MDNRRSLTEYWAQPEKNKSLKRDHYNALNERIIHPFQLTTLCPPERNAENLVHSNILPVWRVLWCNLWFSNNSFNVIVGKNEPEIDFILNIRYKSPTRMAAFTSMHGQHCPFQALPDLSLVSRRMIIKGCWLKRKGTCCSACIYGSNQGLKCIVEKNIVNVIP